jgi:hypothetical protein
VTVLGQSLLKLPIPSLPVAIAVAKLLILTVESIIVQLFFDIAHFVT